MLGRIVVEFDDDIVIAAGVESIRQRLLEIAQPVELRAGPQRRIGQVADAVDEVEDEFGDVVQPRLGVEFGLELPRQGVDLVCGAAPEWRV